jgi:hypothetical protein
VNTEMNLRVPQNASRNALHTSQITQGSSQIALRADTTRVAISSTNSNQMQVHIVGITCKNVMVVVVVVVVILVVVGS